MDEEKKVLSSGDDDIRSKLEDLKRRATRDSLTGLFNRAAFEQYVAERMQQMTEGDVCALFIVDLDDFKRVNDVLGHLAGDEAIRQAGNILSGIFRANDIVGRMGGDEYAAFICGDLTEKTVRRKASMICERVQLTLGDHSIVNVTASVGVCMAGCGQEFNRMYQSTDIALYKAKKSGKFRYCLKTRDGYADSTEDLYLVKTIPMSGLLENMDSGVALIEMTNIPKLIYVSPSFCRIIGADIKTYELPRALTDIVHPDDYAEFNSMLCLAAKEKKSLENTHRVAAPDGESWFWWRVRAVRIEYDSPNPVLLVTTVDISQYKESESRLVEKNMRLQTAFDQISNLIWEVDISTGLFRMFSRDGAPVETQSDQVHFPDDLIDGGWIHPDSIETFRRFSEDLMSGHAQGHSNLAIKSRSTGVYGWIAASYRMIFDEVGHAVRAVGVIEEVPQISEFYDHWGSGSNSIPEGVISDLVLSMRANLDIDVVERFWFEGSELVNKLKDNSCSGILNSGLNKIFSDEERSVYREYFDRISLLKMYSEGKRWFFIEYKRTDSGGNIRPVRRIGCLIEAPMTRQVYLFLYILRLDAKLQSDQLISKARRDIRTLLYDQDTILRIADTIFLNKVNGNRAVAVIQLNGLPTLIPGEIPRVDRVQRDIGAMLSLFFGGSCILGQHGANHIIAVFPSVTDKEALRRRIEENISFMQRMLAVSDKLDSLRILAGVSIAPAEKANYNHMLMQAIAACATSWNSAVDAVTFAQEDSDWNWDNLTYSSDEEVTIGANDMERPLSGLEKDVAFDCVSTMLAARTLDASLLGVLQTIGVYYQADRVYTLILVENQHTVIMTFEWCSSNKRHIQQAVSGMRLDRFPLLESCLEKREPVFISKESADGKKLNTGMDETWNYTAFPLIRGRRVEGFLCIENARQHPKDVALFATLIPYMLRERERFNGIKPVAGTAERLMGLPDLRAYMETIHTLDSERFSSLGAVCLDIPGLAAINSSYGFEYGSKMLWYVVKTLTEIFGSSFLFRTWDAEFVALLPNTTREVFVGRCGRLRSILQRRYPKQIRLGRAWSDGMFTGKRLVDSARAAMDSEAADQAVDIRTAFQGPNGYASVGEAARLGRFKVYFQPMIDMRTGKLNGAEALVRGVDKDGSIIPPSKFISFLEEEGEIRDLDLFVLESALSYAGQWKANGHGVIPVSVNLSRITVMHPTTLASVLAVQSRYPGIPPEALELEITERGDVETSAFSEILDGFRSSGLRFSLDDFGSHYANLSLFTNVKFDTVKLDRSLVSELSSNPLNRTLVQDIIKICDTYEMRCIAEGVETKEQADTLMKMGCNYAQGYYYERPIPADEFEKKYLRGSVRVGS